MMTSGRTKVCCSTVKITNAYCHCRPFPQTLMAASQEKTLGMLHHRQKTYGLLPMLALLTSTDGSIVCNDIWAELQSAA